jgi:3-phenylpropionate/trans-cinnamate dioxygenase ferredoxin reductase component
MTVERGILVMGGGQAACQFVASIRQMGYDGTLTIVSDELTLPYQRPPLSKGYLKGASTTESLHLRPASFYETLRCELRLGERVEWVNRSAREVVLSGGARIFYDSLVFATGARARIFPGLPERDPRIHYLRSLAQAQALKTALSSYRRIGIVGAGYVGMEVAASARQLGIDVTVLEAAPRVMQRSVGEATSAAVHAFHTSNGVDIRLGSSISAVEAAPGGLTIHTKAAPLAVDALVVGIGATPNIELAAAADIACASAILVDANARTNDPHVFAIGDCTEQTHEIYGPGLRLESVQNAVDQAKNAAAILAGKKTPPASVPWFWSDQYSHRIQVAGIAHGHDEIIVRKPAEQDSGKATQSVWYLRQGRLLAVEALDAAADFMAGKGFIQTSTPLDTTRLADASLPLHP